MKFIVMHKTDAAMEAGERPSQRIIQGMGRFVGAALKAGVFEDGAGLHRSATRARVRFDDAGGRTVTRGPYAGEHELVASMALVKAGSLDHAVELATALGRAAGAREVEIGPVVEARDLNADTVGPVEPPQRFLLLRKADAASEAGAAAPAALDALLDEWRRDGVLQSSASLGPSAQGARYRTTGGKRTWSDGPFTESKEMIAGFSIVRMASLAEARAWAEDYAEILGETEVDVRPVL